MTKSPDSQIPAGGKIQRVISELFALNSNAPMLLFFADVDRKGLKNMSSGNNQDNLTAAFIDRTAVLRVEGRGSFKTSPPMKQFIQRMVESKSINHVLIDMSECCGMDSTFMGVLAGLSYHVKDTPGFSLKLINLSEKNQKLLTTLGVDRVVNYSSSATDEERELITTQGAGAQVLESDSANTREAAETTLEAHEALVDINPDNLVKFKSVIELLQNDLRSLDRR